jgi:hypothetical protein
MNKTRLIRILVLGVLAVFLKVNLARAIDPESVPTDVVDRYTQIERTLTVRPGVSVAQQHLLAASLAVSQSNVDDKLAWLSYLTSADAAVIYLKMSDTSFNWTGSAWNATSRNTYSYGPDHLLSQEILELFISLAWTNELRQTFTYNGNGQSLTWLEQLWSTDHWENFYTSTNTYDGSGLVTQSITQNWTMGAWANSTRAIPTYSGNTLASFVVQNWIGSSWVNGYRFVYTYDGSGRLLEMLYQNAAGASWANYQRTTNTYDGSGNLNQSTLETWNGSAYRNVTRDNFSYDGSKNKILSLTYDWDTVGAAFVFRDADTSKFSGSRLMETVTYTPSGNPVQLIRTDYSYDGNGNAIESIRQRFKNAAWENTARTVNVFSVADVGALGGNDESVPRGFSVSQNYPNPFNLSTVIDYSLDRAGPVRVVVANILGQTVSTLVDAYQEEGPHSAIWNGNDANGRVVASGIYFYRIQAAGAQEVRKMVLLK